jgi:dTDP-4-amino-4,6-dideoxygalactose transaminase
MTVDESVITAPIAISTVRLGPEVEAAVLEVLRSGHLAQGPWVDQLERQFADLHGVRHAVAVNNGTTALVAAVQALDLGPGDEVITSPFTFIATVNAIVESGATCRFADIGEDFLIDPAAVAQLIGSRTRAVMPVHLYGQGADLNGLRSVIADRSITIIEDAAQAHGASRDGEPVGRAGLACFSFYATKNLTSGEGGIITTDNDAWADRLRLLRNQGMRQRYQYEIPGHNYRMTDLQAALLVPQLAEYADAVTRRRSNADRLTEGLAGLPGLVTPTSDPGHVFHQYTVRVTPEAPLDRDSLAQALAADKIGHGIYYPRPAWDYDCFRSHPQVESDPTPICRRICREVLSLPVHPHLSDGDLERIVSSVRQAWELA